jgi:Ni,Fe-hydrogenase III small subunit/Fe-S-cluster-containing hydrogenase component 2
MNMFDVLKNGIFKKGIVTTRYPAIPFRPTERFPGCPTFDRSKCNNCGKCKEICPTGAIGRYNGIDMGRCIFCASCADVCPAITMTGEYRLAWRRDTEVELDDLGRELKRKIDSAFGRSLAIREVDAGSCNGCEVEVNALSNAFYDIERFGLRIVASPRHADALLVTGPVTRNMEHALLQTYKATPTPKMVIAMGACAITGGIFRDSYAVLNGVDKVLSVDVYIPGCPPRPRAIIYGIMLAIDRVCPETQDSGPEK